MPLSHATLRNTPREVIVFSQQVTEKLSPISWQYFVLSEKTYVEIRVKKYFAGKFLASIFTEITRETLQKFVKFSEIFWNYK